MNDKFIYFSDNNNGITVNTYYIGLHFKANTSYTKK